MESRHKLRTAIAVILLVGLVLALLFWGRHPDCDPHPLFTERGTALDCEAPTPH